MAAGKLEIIRAVPSSSLLAGLVKRFGENDFGIVTSINDALLLPIRQSLTDQSLVDVKPFGDVVRQVYYESGIGNHRMVTSRQLLTTIALVCQELGPESSFRKVADFRGFHNCLQSLIKEFEHHGIFADELQQLGASIPLQLSLFEDPTETESTSDEGGSKENLKRKLLDLGQMVSDVSALLSEANSISVSKMMQSSLGETLDLDGQEMRLLIFAESEFRPITLQWIQWLVSEGAEVQLVLDRHATEGQIFRGADQCVEFLGLPPKQPGTGNRLLNRLFASSSQGEVESEVSDLDWVELHVASDVLSECEWAIRKCVELGYGSPTQSQEFPKKCAIVCRDLQTYGPILEISARQFGIPLIVRRRHELLTNAFVRTIVDLLKSFASQDVRQLAVAAGNSYIGIRQHPFLDLAYEFSLIQNESSWTLLHQSLLPLVIDPKTDDRMIEDSVVSSVQTLMPLEQLSEVDLKNAEVLAYLTQARDFALKTERTPAEWHSWLRNFIEESPFLTQLLDSPTQARDQRAFTSLLSNLAQDAMVFQVIQSNGQIPLMTFSAWLKHAISIWENATVSVPKPDEGVEVVSSPSELFEVDDLLVLGLIEGAFPKRRSEEPILSDEERRMISQFWKGPDFPTSFDEAFAERDLFYRVCCHAKSGLYLSYPESNDESNSPNIAAFYLQEIRNIYPEVKIERHPRREMFPIPPTTSRDENLMTAFQQPFETASPNLVRTAVELLQLDVKSVMPRDFKRFLQCGFQARARRLVPPPVVESDSWLVLLRLLERSQIFEAKSESDAKAKLYSQLEYLLNDLRPQVPAWELELIRYGAAEYIPKWVDREFRAREAWGWTDATVVPRHPFGGEYLKRGFAETGEVVPYLTDIDGQLVIHLYRVRPPDPNNWKPEKVDDLKKLDDLYAEYLNYLAAAWTPDRICPWIDIEGISEHRLLLTYGPSHIRPQKEEDLIVFDLSDGDASSEVFKERHKKYTRLLKSKLDELQMNAVAGSHCDHCQYSDLCRRSNKSSEADFEETSLWNSEGMEA